MPNALELRFTTRVLGPLAAYRIMKHRVTQTLRSGSDKVVEAILHEHISADERLEIGLDGISAGQAELVSMNMVLLDTLTIDDARAGGFDSISELALALKRAGYRFLSIHEFYRIQFRWLEVA